MVTAPLTAAFLEPRGAVRIRNQNLGGYQLKQIYFSRTRHSSTYEIQAERILSDDHDDSKREKKETLKKLGRGLSSWQP